MKKAKVTFIRVVTDQATEGQCSKTTQTETQRAPENLGQRMTRNGSQALR